ncbi:DMT family transporter [Polynucleobacter sp. MWH-Spelu-300-X4]|uniref:DMT family transporter n=1 Tax=Polynucleobacter sp. MWH-Spelu-300-X4 TaxID=2689109 RepID=UPI001BFE41D1|nr:DMT family transporter [Polynucleobacter sp. MWH-Spelu-300-X4]QWD79180.1 DMT family transporter [Polynucleobacter sp. MWH-Spelu-300-X4]
MSKLASSSHLPKTSYSGVWFLLGALACFALMDGISKHVSLEVSISMIIWARYLTQALLVSAFTLPKHGKAILRTSNLKLQLFRGSLLVITTSLALASLTFMPVGEFTAIVMTTPLFVTLLASRFLNEEVPLIKVLLALGGFIGTLMIVRPGSELFTWHLVFPVCLVLVNIVFHLVTGKISKLEDSLTTLFYTVWTGAFLTSIPLIWFWSTIEYGHLWLELISIGVLGGWGHFLFIRAFEETPAANLMPYMYAQIAFGIFWGWVIFKHVPDHVSLFGIGLIAILGAVGSLLPRIQAWFDGRRT